MDSIKNWDAVKCDAWPGRSRIAKDVNLSKRTEYLEGPVVVHICGERLDQEHLAGVIGNDRLSDDGDRRRNRNGRAQLLDVRRILPDRLFDDISRRRVGHGVPLRRDRDAGVGVPRYGSKLAATIACDDTDRIADLFVGN